MPRSRGATMLVAVVLILIACGKPHTAAPVDAPDVAEAAVDAAASASATPFAPTATITITPSMTPSPVPTAPAVAAMAKRSHQIGHDIEVAGVDVSGLTTTAAQEKLEIALAPLFEPIVLHADAITVPLAPTGVGLKIPYDQMIAEALAASDGTRIPLQVSYDETRVQALLQQLAAHIDRAAVFSVITSTNTLSRSFTLVPGAHLDQNAADQLIGTRLRVLSDTNTLSLPVQADVGHAPAELLQQQIKSVTDSWKGIAGVYVYDLDQATPLAQLNPDTVFSGASVIKVAILLQTYVKLTSFSEKQERWLQKMIVDSDNSSANQLLAASVGGSGYSGMVAGANQMSDMLHDLGLQHTYQYAPYEASDLLIRRGVRLRSGPVHEGAEPFTNADRFVRSTPAEMSRIFVLMHQCSQGGGELLARYAQQLTPARCQEMIDRLHTNADHTRLVAGFPDGTYVAHKSGWIDDMQADVGMVHTPGGNFVIALYAYRSKGMSASRAEPLIANLARLVYTYYNPLKG